MIKSFCRAFCTETCGYDVATLEIKDKERFDMFYQQAKAERDIWRAFKEAGEAYKICPDAVDGPNSNRDKLFEIDEEKLERAKGLNELKYLIKKVKKRYARQKIVKTLNVA